tara:strand:- start:232 stop:600 length:369 start_codon:yes stop_codon:yes gene_type:complete
MEEITFDAVILSTEITAGTNEDGTPKPRWFIAGFKSIDPTMPGIQNEFIIPVNKSTDVEIGKTCRIKYTPKGFTWSKGKTASKDYWSFKGCHGDLTVATKNIKAVNSFNATVNDAVNASMGE